VVSFVGIALPTVSTRLLRMADQRVCMTGG